MFTGKNKGNNKDWNILSVMAVISPVYLIAGIEHVCRYLLLQVAGFSQTLHTGVCGEHSWKGLY